MRMCVYVRTQYIYIYIYLCIPTFLPLVLGHLQSEICFRHIIQGTLNAMTH